MDEKDFIIYIFYVRGPGGGREVHKYEEPHLKKPFFFPTLRKNLGIRN